MRFYAFDNIQFPVLDDHIIHRLYNRLSVYLPFYSPPHTRARAHQHSRV